MSQTGQIAVSYPGDDLTLFFNTTDLPSAINEVNNKPDGAQVTLYAGDYMADSSAIDNLSSNRWMVLLPGAKIDYNAFSSSKISQISDLDQLSTLDDILDPLDEFLDPDPTLGEGQIAYYDAVDDKMRYTDLLLVDNNNQKIDIQDLEIDQDINFETESESLLTKLDKLEGLLPQAPPLDYTEESGQPGESGRLSFGSSNNISGVTNDPDTDFTQLFDITTNQRGIVGVGDGNFSGVLNDDVQSTTKYDADSFGRADEGKLKLIVNGNVITGATVDLTDLSDRDTRTSGTGLKVSAASNVNFSDGSTFSDGWQRTGQWYVSEKEFRTGYNTIRVEHVDNSGSPISKTNVLGYIYDDEGTAISFFSNNTGIFGPLQKTGANFLSGVEYDTSATAFLEADVENVYLYTYKDGNAITFPLQTNFSVSSIPIPSPSDETDVVSISEQVVSDDILIDEGFEGSIRIDDPVESSAEEGPNDNSQLSRYSFLIDGFNGNNGPNDQKFNNEARRLLPDDSTDDFTQDVSPDWSWNSEKDISDSGDQYYNDGIQIKPDPGYNQNFEAHYIGYPNFDYSTVTDGPPENSDRDYTNSTGRRHFFGYFENLSGNSIFVLYIYGSGTFIEDGTSFTNGSDQIKFAFRLPSQTGWLDVTRGFQQGLLGNVNDGDPFGPAVDGGQNKAGGDDFDMSSGPAQIGITSGTTNTDDSFDKIYYRILVPEGWTGNIQRVRIDF